MADKRKYTGAVRLLAQGQSVRVELFPAEQWPERQGFQPGTYRLRIDGAWLDADQAHGILGQPASDDDGQPYMHFATLDGVARLLTVRLARMMGLPVPDQPDVVPPLRRGQRALWVCPDDGLHPMRTWTKTDAWRCPATGEWMVNIIGCPHPVRVDALGLPEPEKKEDVACAT